MVETAVTMLLATSLKVSNANIHDKLLNSLANRQLLQSSLRRLLVVVMMTSPTSSKKRMTHLGADEVSLANGPTACFLTHPEMSFKECCL